MPGKLFYLDDQRTLIVNQRDFNELSVLPTEPGPRLVVAKGTVRGANVEFNVRIRLRLEVHAMLSGLIGFDETEFFTEPANIGPGGVLVTSGNPDTNSFMLVVAANMPFEGSGGLGPPLPPHRAVLLARKETASNGAGLVTNLKITSFPLDEIVATVLSPPEPPPAPPE
jgi:hypothetical protein